MRMRRYLFLVIRRGKYSSQGNLEGVKALVAVGGVDGGPLFRGDVAGRLGDVGGRDCCWGLGGCNSEEGFGANDRVFSG